MSFFKKNNKKVIISKMEISSILSKLYSHVYKDQLVKHRDELFNLIQQIYNDVERIYGLGEEQEILIEDFYKVIKSHLPQGYLIHNFDELFSLNGIKRQKFYNWNLEVELTDNIIVNKTQYNKIIINLSQEEWFKFFEKLSIYYIEQSNYFFFYEVFKNEMLKISKMHLTKNSEEWFDFFCDKIRLIQNKEPRIVYLLQALHIRKKLAALLGKEWIDELKNVGEHKERNIFYLKKPIIQQHNKFEIINKNSLENSFYEKEFLLESSYSKDSLFKSMTYEYLLRFFSEEELKNINIKKLCENVQLKREYLITYLSEHLFIKNNALLEIDNLEWVGNIDLKRVKTKKTFEPLQWLFLRTSIKLALSLCKKTNLNNCTEQALLFYNHLSELNIILPLSFYREINKSLNWENFNFVKNFSALLQDDYDDIQQTIFNSIKTTKWTGSVYLDFSQLRKKGSSIRQGLRISNGIKPYIEMLNGLIKTQGREKWDCPISVSLPIYSYEIKSLFLDKEEIEQTIEEHQIFIEAQKEERNNNENISFSNKMFNGNSLAKIEKEIEIDHHNLNNEIQFDFLNRVIILSDLFLWKIYSNNLNEEWYLMDEYHFKNQFNLDISQEQDYLKAEELILNKNVKKEYYKKVNAKKLFKQIILLSKHNNISFVFESVFKNNKEFLNQKLIYSSDSLSAFKANNEVAYSNFGLVLDKDIHKNKNILFAYFLLSYLFKDNNPILNILGLEKFDHNNKKNNALISLFVSIEELKEYALFKKFTNDKIKEHFNDFVISFNKNRKQTNYLPTINEDLNKKFNFNNALLNNAISFNDYEELSYIANVEQNYLGIKKSLVEIYDNGKKETYHTPTFILNYHKNIVEHEIFEKVFMKKSFSYFKKHKILKLFYPSIEDLREELEFYKNFVPFFKKGLGFNISKNMDTQEIYNFIIMSWLNGISSINLK